MGEATKIEWTDSTFNPWIGCTKIAPACDHCYAADMAKRYGWVEWGNHPRKRTSTSLWAQPKKWQREAAAFFAEHGRRRRVFCSSLADVFDNQVPTEWHDDLWALIRSTPDLDWLLLTKRPQNIEKMLPEYWGDVKAHVWLGTTVEDQAHADQNIPHLLKHDAAVRFISAEPMLGPMDIRKFMWPVHPRWPAQYRSPEDAIAAGAEVTYHRQALVWAGRTFIDWVIAGGESGPHARPSDPAWFKSLRDQCTAAGVPFLFKQWGEWTPGENVIATSGVVATANHYAGDWTFGRENLARADGHRDDEPDVYRVGKRAAGRTLDGVQHDGFPRAAA